MPRPTCAQDALDHRIGLGVDGRGVERVVAVARCAGSRPPARSSWRRGAAPRGAGGDCGRRRARRDGARCWPPSDRAEPGDARQQRRRGGVDVDADGVDAVLDHRVERARQLGLVDVVLVLADADRLGVDLHQLGERVLQAARDRHRAAQRDVEVGKLAAPQLGGRVDRGAGLADHHLGQAQLGMPLDQVGGQAVGLARGGAVADADQLHRVLRRQARPACAMRAVPVVARRVRVDGRGRPAACRWRRPPRP